MFAINSPLTAAPDVNQKSNYFEGYNSGWTQMSDAIKRMQTKRSMDQEDNRQSIDVWRTKVNANLEQQRINLANKQFAQGVQTDAWAQAYKLNDQALQSRRVDVEQQMANTNQLKVHSDIEDRARDAQLTAALLSKRSFYDTMQEKMSALGRPVQSIDVNVSRKENPVSTQQAVMGAAQGRTAYNQTPYYGSDFEAGQRGQEDSYFA